MWTRTIIYRGAALLATALLIGAVAPPLGSQVPPTTTKTPPATAKKPAVSKTKKEIVTKEPVVKQAGGEVALPCAIDDDSLARALSALRNELTSQNQAALEEQRTAGRLLAAAELRRELANMKAVYDQQRADELARAEAEKEAAALALKRSLARGFYIGAAAGASTPMRDLRNGYTGGWNTTVPVGWDATDSFYGFRVDGSVDHLNGTRLVNAQNVTTAASGDISVYSLNVDAKLRLHAPGTPTRSHIYALGGVGAHRVTEGVYGTIGPNAGQNLSFGDAKTSFGWNVGGGVAMAFGPTELFAEARFFQVKSDLNYHMANGVGTYTNFTPIVIGLQWF